MVLAEIGKICRPRNTEFHGEAGHPESGKSTVFVEKLAKDENRPG